MTTMMQAIENIQRREVTNVVTPDKALVTLVTWVAHPAVRAGDADRCRTAPLHGALARVFKCDAHVQQFTSRLGCRLSSKHVQVGAVAGCRFFDLDPPGHDATPEWRAQTGAQVAQLRQGEPAILDYPTDNGHRIVRILPVPFTVTGADDAARWRSEYLSDVAELQQRHGLECDVTCADWTRLFRLPHVVRSEPRTRTHHLPREAIREAGGRHAPAAPYEPEIDPTWGTPISYGELYDAAIGAGIILQRVADSADGAAQWAIVCPFENSHTAPRSIGDCILIGAKSVTDWGWIRCRHNHCAQRPQQHFRDAILEAARRAAPPSVELSRGQMKCIAVAALSDDPTDDQLLALRLGARDAYSAMKLSELRALHGIGELRDHPYELPALRWVGRGLPSPLAVRWAFGMHQRHPK